jgi:hypothetical protein
MSGAELFDCDLGRADFSNADLTSASFEGSSFTDSTMLRDANLSGARLKGVRFNGANLKGATLETDLTKTSFKGSNLKGAKLNGRISKETNFQKCDLRGADFTGFEGDLDPEMFLGSNIDETTKGLPKGFATRVKTLENKEDFYDTYRPLRTRSKSKGRRLDTSKLVKKDFKGKKAGSYYDIEWDDTWRE